VSEVVERVARAICAADNHGWPGDDYNGRTQRRFYEKQARAAIAAMREDRNDSPGMSRFMLAAVVWDLVDTIEVLLPAEEAYFRKLKARVEKIIAEAWAGKPCAGVRQLTQAEREALERATMDAHSEFDALLGNAQAIEAQRAETGTGSVHESAVGEADAPVSRHDTPKES
jgi:DNA replication initiation complex subunit (GINS family)